MINFKKPEITDKPWIDELCKAENSRSADYSFGNIFMWDSRYHQKVARIGDRLAILLNYDTTPFFAFPVGSGELRDAIRSLQDYAAAEGFPFRMRGVTAEHATALRELFPDEYQYTEDRAYYDYIYSAEKLASLSGKKLHGKRNHINRFVEDYPDWSFVPLTTALIPECNEMLDSWTLLNQDELERGLRPEHDALMCGFENYETLGLEGGALYTGGRMVAFTIGERISTDTYNMHFEKAFADIQGAYPMVNREFVRLTLERYPEIRYINREDDMGHENLRRAKLSYRPEFLIEKYIVGA